MDNVTTRPYNHLTWITSRHDHTTTSQG